MDEKHTSENVISLKSFVGYFLIFVGVVFAIWIVMNVISIYNHPTKLTEFQTIVSDRLESVISTSDEKIVLIIPPEFLTYFIPIVLLVIAVALAKLFILGGIKVLQSDFQKVTNEISDLKSALGNVFNEYQKK